MSFPQPVGGGGAQLPVYAAPNGTPPNGNGTTVAISAGDAAGSGFAGALNLSAGSGGTTGVAGSASLTGGDASVGTAGGVRLTAGTGNGTANGGNITVVPGYAFGSGAPGYFVASNLPTVAPSYSGAVWRDPITNILHIVP